MSTWSALFGTPPQFARRMAFATAFGLFFGLIGPFGSYDAAPLERVASWLVVFWTGTLAFGAAYRLAEGWSQRSGVPRLFARSIAVLVAAAPLSVFAALCFHLVVGVRIVPRDALLWYAQVVAIGLPTTLGYVLLAPTLPRASATAEPAADQPAEIAAADAGTLFAQLPERLGAEVIALQMEDHYVRVHTPRGSALVLMPMGQAVAAVDDLEGERVHRSWWVARSAVQDAVRDGRNLRLRLAGGLEAPVARTAVARLRGAGWFEVAGAGAPRLVSINGRDAAPS